MRLGLSDVESRFKKLLQARSQEFALRGGGCFGGWKHQTILTQIFTIFTQIESVFKPEFR